MAAGNLLIYTGNGAENQGFGQFALAADRTPTTSATLPNSPAGLDQYQCIVLPIPTEPFSTADRTALRDYMGRGGTIVGLAEHLNADLTQFKGKRSVDTLNALGSGYGIVGGKTSVNLGAHITENVLPSSYTQGVTRVGFGGTTTLAVSPPAQALLQTTQGPGDPTPQTFLAVSDVGAGKFVYTGDSNLFSDENGGYYAQDNGKLAKNLCSDTKPPLITITAPVAGARYAKDQVVPAQWTCTDIDSGVDTQSFTNEALSGTVSGTPFDTTVPAGQSVTKTFSVDCTDKAGNVAPTKQVQYVVDNRPPTITITIPDAGPYALGSPVSADWTCTDPDNDVATRGYTNGPLSGVQSGQPIVTAPKGLKSYTVTCTDLVGNSATPQTVQYTVANSPPVASITAPAGGLRLKAGAAVNAVWGCTDPDGAGDIATASFTNEALSGTQSGLAIDTSAAPGTTVIKTFSVTCTDSDGASSAPKQVTYIIDANPPVASIAVPLDGGVYERRSSAPAAWECIDPDGPEDIDPNPAKTFGTRPVGQPIDTGTVGTKSFSVTCADRVGNVSAPKAVQYTVIDASPPVVTITVPKDGATYGLGQVVAPSYACVDADGISDIRSCVRANGATGPVDTSKAGTFEFTVNGEDLAGNKGTATVRYTVSGKPAPASAGVAPAATPGATKVCKSRRQFRIRVKKLRGGVRAVSATVFVNGKKTLTRKGKRVTAIVTLKGLKKGRYTVKINVKYSNGRTLRYTRKFKTCTPKGK